MRTILAWRESDRAQREFIERSAEYMAQSAKVKTIVEVASAATPESHIELESTTGGNVVLRVFKQIGVDTWETESVAIVNLQGLKKAVDVMLSATGGGGE